MNSQIDLLSRLLKLYPVKLIKEEFDLDGKADIMVSTIIAAKPQKEIFEFCLNNISFTRQHVFIFDLNKEFKSANFQTNAFPLSVIEAINLNNECVIKCLPTVEFDVVVLNPFLETTIKFYQPIQIKISKKHLIIQVTTLEKNLSHYFEEGRKVVDSKRTDGEDASLSAILAFFNQTFTVKICDLHKGIKKLWENDVIDSKYLKTKKSKGTNTLAMDENWTVKKEYPNEYNDMIDKPILKTLFRYIGQIDGYFCNHFSADPLQGQIGIAAFPENAIQLENIIYDIIKYN